MIASLMLAALISLQPSNPSAKIQWIQPAGELEKDKSTDIYLLIPRSPAYDTIRISFFENNGKTLIRDNDVITKESGSYTWQGGVISDTLIRVTLKPEEHQSFGIVAIVYSVDKKGNKRIVEVIPTATFSVRKEDDQLINYLPNLITTIIAFVAGALSVFFQKSLETFFKRKEVRREAEKSLVQHLMPEIAEHNMMLKKYIAGDMAHIKNLPTYGFETFLSIPGYEMCFDKPERGGLFNRIDAYYKKDVEQFNIKVTEFIMLSVEEKKVKAEEMKSEVKKMLEKVLLILNKKKN